MRLVLFCRRLFFKHTWTGRFAKDGYALLSMCRVDNITDFFNVNDAYGKVNKKRGSGEDKDGREFVEKNDKFNDSAVAAIFQMRLAALLEFFCTHRTERFAEDGFRAV